MSRSFPDKNGSSSDGKTSSSAFRTGALSFQILALAMAPFLVSILLIISVLCIAREMQLASSRERSGQRAANDCITLSHSMLDGIAEYTLFNLRRGEGTVRSFEEARVRLPDIVARLKSEAKGDENLTRLADDIQVTGRAILRLADESIVLLSIANPDLCRSRVAEINSLMEPAIIRTATLLADFSTALDAAIARSPAGSAYYRKVLLLVVTGGLLILVAITLLSTRLLEKKSLAKLDVLARNADLLAKGKPLLLPLEGNDELTDIDSAFRHMATNLEASRRREFLAVSEAADVIVTLSENLDVTYVNPQAGVRWGMTPAELQGTSLLCYVEGNVRSETQDAFHSAKDQGEKEIELELVLSPDRVISTLFFVRYSKIDASYFCVVTDISERKRLEKELQESESRLNSILSYLPVGVLLLKNDLTLEYANDAAKTMLRLDKLKPDAALDVKMFFSADSASAGDGQNLEGPTVKEFSIAGGGTFIAEMFVRQVQGMETRYLLVFLDVSEREALRKERAKLVSVLVDSVVLPLEEIIDSLSEVSHSETLGKVALEKLQRISNETHRLARLLTELIETAAGGTISLEMVLKPHRIDELLNNSAESMKELAQRKSVSITVTCAEMEFPIDRDRFQQVLTNLLSNAIKFSPRSGKISIRGASEEGGISLTVADEGPGIPTHLIDDIFQPFKQVSLKDATRLSGNGLGLYISRSIIERMGGRLSVTNNEDRGATFMIWIPIEE